MFIGLRILLCGHAPVQVSVKCVTKLTARSRTATRDRSQAHAAGRVRNQVDCVERPAIQYSSGAHDLIATTTARES